jgi:uncharacterized membrane protein
VTTDQLIAHHAASTVIPVKILDRVIPLAIDAIYLARDRGDGMHEAGAAAAVAVLLELGYGDR